MKYVALLRGIGPLNPNMRNEKLRGVLEGLGLKNVHSVISSGNVLFESGSKNVKALEDKIEKAWPAKLGFNSTTIIRSHDDLKRLVGKEPFNNIEDGPKSSLNVTFLKTKPTISLKFPYHSPDNLSVIFGIHDQAVCSAIDLTSSRTPNLMVWLEKQFGKEVTTRTWKTVHRILKKMNDS